jgi:hypothetical protein
VVPNFAQDVGRFIELLGVNGAGTDWGLYQISAVQEELLQGGQHAVRIVVSTTDQHTGTNTVGISNRRWNLRSRLPYRCPGRPCQPRA